MCVCVCYLCMYVCIHYLLLSACHSISLLLFPFIFSAGGIYLYNCLAVPQAYRPFSSRVVNGKTEQKKLSKCNSFVLSIFDGLDELPYCIT